MIQPDSSSLIPRDAAYVLRLDLYAFLEERGNVLHLRSKLALR